MLARFSSSRGAIALAVLIALPVAARGETATVVGFAIDSENAISTVASSDAISVTLTDLFRTGNNDSSRAFTNTFVGSLILGGARNDAYGFAATLGDALTAERVDVGWGGRRLPNFAGDDFVLFEEGSPGGPEAYAVAVRPLGGTFSDFRYEFRDGDDARSTLQVGFVSGFDLSDFGLAPGALVDAVAIRNLTVADRVDQSDGQGFLGGTFMPLADPGGTAYDLGRFDPDMSFAGSLHALVAVPEPSTLVGLLSLGFLALLSRWRRSPALRSPGRA
jgi:hypothetical protein